MKSDDKFRFCLDGKEIDDKFRFCLDGNKIDKILKDKNLKQSHLTGKGISRSHLSKILNENPLVKKETVNFLAKALKIDEKSLIIKVEYFPYKDMNTFFENFSNLIPIFEESPGTDFLQSSLKHSGFLTKKEIHDQDRPHHSVLIIPKTQKNQIICFFRTQQRMIDRIDIPGGHEIAGDLKSPLLTALRKANEEMNFPIALTDLIQLSENFSVSPFIGEGCDANNSKEVSTIFGINVPDEILSTLEITAIDDDLREAKVTPKFFEPKACIKIFEKNPTLIADGFSKVLRDHNKLNQKFKTFFDS